MRSSKNALAATAAVLAVVLILSAVLSSQNPRQEATRREKEAGSYDLLVVGASQAECAFIPSVLDETLGCTSYNLAISAMTNDDKYLLLEKELARNPVKTVVLEMSYNAMTRPNKNDLADGNYSVYNNLWTFGEKADYLLAHTPLDNWLYVYAKDVITGLQGILSWSNDRGKAENRGFTPCESQNVSLSAEEATAKHGSIPYSMEDYLADTIDGFDRLVTLCKRHDVRIIVAVVPISDALLWEYQGMDSYRQWLEDFCEERQIECYDFNLHLQRYQSFDDAVSYGTSDDHMSEKGALAFSKLFAQTINAADRDIQFYESYEAMQKDSPYWQMK